ncbi:MAG TPA: hypothetical protein VJ044_10285, partial [Candidatus Hodarchaeales archaeon]|nr:hypothetical protein [Candidatus Hodarchaeales archaeon]
GSDLLLNDLSNGELKKHEQEFKMDAGRIELRRRDLVRVMQDFWKTRPNQHPQIERTLADIREFLDDLKGKYQAYRLEVREALDIYLEDNARGITEVEDQIRRLSKAIGRKILA